MRKPKAAVPGDGESVRLVAERPILIIDDDPNEGERVRLLLVANGNRIDCIASTPTAVRHALDASVFTGQLIAALHAISIADGAAFRRVTEQMPSVVILDQFLPDPNPDVHRTTMSASLRVQELVNDIWEKVIESPAFGAMAWNVCILMYTGQSTRQMADGLVRQVTNKDWFAYAQKPLALTGRSNREIEDESARFVAQINSLTARKKSGDADEAVFELYAGIQGHRLLNAVSMARAQRKPIWLQGREQDGWDRILTRVLGYSPSSAPLAVDEVGLLEQLRRLRAPPRNTNPVFALVGRITQTARLREAARHVERTRFVVISDRAPEAALESMFNVVTLVPLYEWSVDDLKGVFRACFSREPDEPVLHWLKERRFNYLHLDSWYFSEGEPITISAIKYLSSDLQLDVLALALAGETVVTVRWEGRVLQLDLSSSPDTCACAVLVALAKDPARKEFGTADLVNAMRELAGPAVDEWAKNMGQDNSFKKNYFVSADRTAEDILAILMGVPAITMRGYKNAERFQVKWIAPKVRVVVQKETSA